MKRQIILKAFSFVALVFSSFVYGGVIYKKPKTFDFVNNIPNTKKLKNIFRDLKAEK